MYIPRNSWCNPPRLLLLLLVMTVAATRSVHGQGGEAFGGFTPAGVAPGTPAGSYGISGIEHYNPFSGTLNASLPLYHVGGRGEAGFDLVWNLQPQWTATKLLSSNIIAIDPYPSNNIAFGGSNAYALGGPGAVYIRTGATFTTCGGGALPGTTLTTVTFVAGNGTEINLIDSATAGAVYNVPNACSSSPSTWNAGRGTAFHSVDGSALQFISDAAVLEQNPTAAGHGDAKVSGLLVFPTGLTYRIDNSNVSWIRDRNGNKISLSYTGAPAQFVDWYLAVLAPTQVVDSLNRTININYSDSSCGGCASINYSGAGGAARVIRVYVGSLGNSLRPGSSLQTIDQLFPGTGQPTSYNYNPSVANAIRFADGRQYTFQYNSYGELARLVLPTGGAREYDYGDGNGSGSGFYQSGTTGSVMVYRRLQERREYATGGSGSSYSLRTRYSQNSSGNLVDTDTSYDSGGNALSQTIHTMSGSPLDVLQMSGTSCNTGNEGAELQTDMGYPNPIVTVQYVLAVQTGCMNNPQVTTRTTTLRDTNQVSSSSYTYDGYGNVTDQLEYDWGTGAAGPLLRETRNTLLWASNVSVYTAPSVNFVRFPLVRDVYNASGTRVAESVWHYDESALQDDPGIVGHDSSYGTGLGVRGNVTTAWNWLNTSNGFVGTTLTYDIAGNVTASKDPAGHITSFFYNDDGSGRYALANRVVNALNQSSTASYDYNIGQPTSVTDANVVATLYTYNDALERVTEVRQAAGTNLEAQTYWAYPSTTETDVYQDQNNVGDGALRIRTLLDGLGRPVEQDRFESGSQYIATTTTYDALGRVAATTNPSRPGDGLNFSTSYRYDSLSRSVQVITAGGASASTAYSGNQTTATDQAGHTRRTTTDGVGRLSSVLEAPGGLNYSTAYVYDVLDDLTGVTQSGQTRSFVYDSLQRLTSAVNPESGSVAYTYYDTGDVHTRTDARGVGTTFTYDALNRLTGKSYSNGTPAVTYSYDPGVANGKGQLGAVSNAVSTTSYSSFDALGRVLASAQSTAGQSYNFAYGYNLAGALKSETYPSGRSVTSTFDGAGRVAAMSGQSAGVTTSYVATASYAPQGALTSLLYGNNVGLAYSYNSRLQVSQLAVTQSNNASRYLGSWSYQWGTTNNNGSVYGVSQGYGAGVPYASLSWFTQSFGYDGVNRLASASDTGGWSRTFSYDAYGNGWVYNAGGIATGAPTSDVFNAKNQMGSVSYDAAGNQVAVSGNTQQYDAENRQSASTDGVTQAVETYSYDGVGQRVQKAGPSGTTVYVYDALGQLAAEYSTVVSTPACTTCYLAMDLLGTPRVVTDGGGQLIGRHDYLPFGEEIAAGAAGRTSQWGAGNDGVRQKFTGQERDQETGLDFFQARYYASALGRFTSPDPYNAGADLSNPQSWNGYAYVNGNPLNATDASGLAPIAVSTGVGYGSISHPPYGSLGVLNSVLNNGLSYTSFDLLQLATTPTSSNPEPGPLYGSSDAILFYAEAFFSPNNGTNSASERKPQKTGKTLTCSGTARVLRGNSTQIGLPGGWDGPFVRPHILVTQNGAAIIPSQWGVTNKTAFRPYLNLINGTFPSANASFTGVSEIIGGAPDPKFPNAPVQQGLMTHYPGDLIIELPGGKDLGQTAVMITTPAAVGCPAATTQVP